MDPIVTTAVSIAAKPVSNFLGRVFKPFLARAQGKIEEKINLHLDLISKAYDKYCENAYNRHSYFISLVFQNEQKKLEDYYKPLTLIDAKDQKSTIINDYPSELLKSIKNLLIVDTAGMGKTTILKYIFLKCIESGESIPLFIELRKLSKNKSLIQYISDELLELNDKQKPESLFQLLDSGDFLILLDGYDEIPEKERQFVVTGIQKFIEKAPNNKYILSSRDDQSLIQFANFKRHTIQPLKKEEAYQLIRSYSPGQKSERLIEKLESPEGRIADVFLGNPLLVSLLFKSYEYKPDIPTKRSIFYRQVYEALYDSHDLSKEHGGFKREKKSALDTDDFHRLIRSLAIKTYLHKKYEYTKDDLLAHITDAIKATSFKKVSPSDFLDDLINAVPLMIRDGNYIRWSHRSIQEYFSACYISLDIGDQKEELIEGFYSKKDGSLHANMLSLFNDLDSKTFRRFLLKPIANDLIAEYDQLYTNATPEISKELIEERKRLTCGKLFIYGISQEEMQSEVIKNGKGRDESVDKIIDFLQKTQYQEIVHGWQVRAPSNGIVFVMTSKSNLIGELFNYGAIPFIKPINKTTINQPLEKEITASLQIVSDKIDQPYNHPREFKEFNKIFSVYSEWVFSIDDARALITSTEEEEREKSEFNKLFKSI